MKVTCVPRKSPSDRLFGSAPQHPPLEPRFGLLAPATNKPILVAFRAAANKKHQPPQTQLPRPRRLFNRLLLENLG